MRSVEDRQAVARLHRGGQVGAEAVLEVTHAVQSDSRTPRGFGVAACGSLAACRRLGSPRRARPSGPPCGPPAWSGSPAPPASAYSAGVEVRWFALRRADAARAARRPPAAEGAARLRPAPDPGAGPQAGVGARRWPTWSPTWWSTPATTWRTSEAVPALLDALGPLLDVPGVFVLGLQRLLRADAAQPDALPAARRRPAQHPHADRLPQRRAAGRLRAAAAGAT